jgi:hypothetical protein
MTVRVRLPKPSLFCPGSRAEIIDPLRGRLGPASTHRELWLWSVAAAGYFCILLALTRLGA